MPTGEGAGQGGGSGTPDGKVLRLPPRDLGLGELARALGIRPEETSGHWCSRCRGIWYGYLLEVTCPACGNRRG